MNEQENLLAAETEEPEVPRKVGLPRFFELLGRDLWSFFRASFLCGLGWLPGFALLKSIPIRFSFTVEGQQVQNLFAMTPHLFRVSKAGAERLRNTQSLTDTASCVLNVFRRT